MTATRDRKRPGVSDRVVYIADGAIERNQKGEERTITVGSIAGRA